MINQKGCSNDMILQNGISICSCDVWVTIAVLTKEATQSQKLGWRTWSWNRKYFHNVLEDIYILPINR